MFTHNLDPVLFDFGVIAIRWYSLAYIGGILGGWWLGKKLINKRFKSIGKQFSLKEFDDLITYLIISMIVGGRLGYIIFYNLGYYISNPLDILKIWEGGMSFHGALSGIIIGTYLFSQSKKISCLFLLDIIACVSPIGLFFGRISNFINGELIGKVTSVSWGIVFPNIDMLVRHPSQLYEALLEGVVLFFILNIFIFKKNYRTGTCSFLFLVFYGFFRIFSEIFREPDPHLGYFLDLFSMGTILSLLMILSGMIIFIFIKKNEI